MTKRCLRDHDVHSGNTCGRSAAELADLQASGQRRPAGGGTLNDVTTIATVMPACDAIYVDNEVAAFLNEEPLRTQLDFGTHVFSQRTRHEFAAYLDEIRDAAPDEHVAAVREVYGDSYLTPFTGLFNLPE